MSRLSSGDGQPPFSTSLDGRVLAFNFTVAVGMSLLFALAPALQFWKPNLVDPMKQQTAASTGGRLTFRRVTVSLQIGLSLLLLVCSGLFVRTLTNLRNVNVGFATDHLITFGLDPNLSGYNTSAVVPLHKRVLESIAGAAGRGKRERDRRPGVSRQRRERQHQRAGLYGGRRRRYECREPLGDSAILL